MYANSDSVKALATNVRGQIDDNFIAVHARLVDSIIDAKLGEVFEWPKDSNGNATNNPVPSIIVEIANQFTAGRVERAKFSMNEASGQLEGNPYAANLERNAKELLDQIVEGTLIIPELAMLYAARSTTRPQQLREVHGSGMGFGRRKFN